MSIRSKLQSFLSGIKAHIQALIARLFAPTPPVILPIPLPVPPADPQPVTASQAVTPVPDAPPPVNTL